MKHLDRFKARGRNRAGIWYEGHLTILTKDTWEQFKGCYISNSAGMPFAYKVEEKTLGLFTGFDDKVGVSIFEDDIIHDTWLGDYYVVDEMTVAGWLIDEDKMNQPMKHTKVAGNIHDNPHLIADKRKERLNRG